MKRTITFPTVPRIIGIILPLVLWIALTATHTVSDRYLPSLPAVIEAGSGLNPNLFIHILFTTTRLTIGFICGSLFGIVVGISCARSTTLRDLAEPFIQSTRSVPGVALVPFFLLWFGFSELGRYILVVAGISFNISIATMQILTNIPESHRIMFNSLGTSPRAFTIRYMLPFSLQKLLPTIRFSLSTAIGLIVTSELLGSQVGLGYLVQTSVNTFSFSLVFLVAIVLGILSVIADGLLIFTWRYIVFWRQS